MMRLLGFKWRPSYKTAWHQHNVRVKAEGLIVIHENPSGIMESSENF